MENRCVAVIIPFYQREPGILRRAVTSVFNQKVPTNISLNIYIIDDSSPLPPNEDLVDLPIREGFRLSVHHQSNAGPGGARNRGLDLADAEQTEFIAFLDSDDIWEHTHIADAIDALDKGYGFYFCDNTRDGAHDSYNDSVPILQDYGKNIKERSDIISNKGPVLGFPRHKIAREMIADYLCQTSCVVAKRSSLQGRRFDVEQRVAGEDYLFWIGIAINGPDIAISWKKNVSCGQGINLFFSAFDWDNPRTVQRLGYILLLAEKLNKCPQAMEIARQEIKTMLRKSRTAYSFLFFRSALKGKLYITDGIFLKIMRFDRFLPLRIPFLFLRVIIDRRIERNF